jgi:hypothetical protein
VLTIQSPAHSASQDSRLKDEAIRAIKDNSDAIEREKRNAEEQERALDKEEKVLEGIRDSLKGSALFPDHNSRAVSRYCQIRHKSFMTRLS